MSRAPNSKTLEVESKAIVPKDSPEPGGDEPGTQHLDIWDRKSKRSLINLLPRKIAQRCEDYHFERPELFDIGEDELRDIFRAKGRKISTTENQMRLRLWYEFETCHAHPDLRFTLARVTAGLCSEQTFYTYLTSVEAVAWLMCPPISYDVHIDELLNFGSAKMREVLALPAMDPVTQKIDTKLLKLQFDIYIAAEMRKFGAIPQITKNMHLHGRAPTGDPKELEERSESLMLKKVEELKARQRKSLNPPAQKSSSGGLGALGVDEI